MTWNLLKKTERNESDFGLLQREFDSFFDDFFAIKSKSLFENEWVPAIDVKDDGNKITIKADMPGLSEKDINVSIENNMLNISGEKLETTESKGNCVISERKFGSFRRSLALPDNIKTDEIKAEFKNGVLSIEVSRDEAAKQGKIEVKVN